MSTRRQDQVNELVRHEVSALMPREIEVPRGVLVTISRVETSSDLDHARVFVTIWPVERRDEVWDQLNKQLGRIQRLLNRRLHMERVPQLVLALDHSEDKADRLNRLLDTLGE